MPIIKIKNLTSYNFLGTPSPAPSVRPSDICISQTSGHMARLCAKYPCEKFNNADLYDSFFTHRNQFRDMDKAKRIGVEAYKVELNKKIKHLEVLLNNYDDGRRKNYYYVAVYPINSEKNLKLSKLKTPFL